MTGPRGTGREYTGKHRRDGGPGALPPTWGGRAEPNGRPVADGRTAPGATPMPGPGAASLPGPGAASLPGFRPEPGQWADAG
jgi:hypothetical protein